MISHLTRLGKKLFRTFLYLLYTGIIAGIGLEVAYRLYLVDFYRPELNALNAGELITRKDSTVLVAGDSFTADLQGYVSVLRRELSTCRVINAGVPGTGIVQASLLLPTRIREFQPDIFIYQLYVGNDLLDIRHPWNGKTLGFSRNLYWWLSDRMRSLAFLNYRMAGLRYRYYSDFDATYSPKSEEVFSPRAYSPRQRLYFQAEPSLVENSAFLEEGREKDFEVLTKNLDAIFTQLDSACQIFLLVIPHCMQVDSVYLERMLTVGAKTKDPSRLLQDDFPLLTRLEKEFSGSRVKVVNSLSLFQDPGLNRSFLYYPNDPHLTPRGHEVLGQGIIRLIKEKSTP